MEYGQQKIQHDQEEELQLLQDNIFVKVMTDEQMEILRKQIAAYATICEQLEDLYRALISQNYPSTSLSRNPYYPNPLTASATGSSLHRIRRRQRWNPTSQQLYILERAFNQGEETPSKEKVKDIATELEKHGQISETNVYNWFQNRRARMKKKQTVLRENRKSSAESEVEEGEISKNPIAPEPEYDDKKYCVEKGSGGIESMFSFGVEGFHGGISSGNGNNMDHLLDDMEVYPSGSYESLL